MEKHSQLVFFLSIQQIWGFPVFSMSTLVLYYWLYKTKHTVHQIFAVLSTYNTGNVSLDQSNQQQLRLVFCFLSTIFNSNREYLDQAFEACISVFQVIRRHSLSFLWLRSVQLSLQVIVSQSLVLTGLRRCSFRQSNCWARFDSSGKMILSYFVPVLARLRHFYRLSLHGFD